MDKLARPAVVGAHGMESNIVQLMSRVVLYYSESHAVYLLTRNGYGGMFSEFPARTVSASPLMKITTIVERYMAVRK